ncbi:MAG: peptidoglycan DD-metalloendopeptidase family protein [Candidatus Zambryskibacteria bacterium]|nr:peptidoglycan DD-metalloendopeptidase family protein [Candidatus Zambryskibacteria bacterium]
MVYARSQEGQVLLMPEVAGAGNSQTMSLLEGYLNINPTGTGGAEIAIVDSVALESTGGESEVFVDLGKSGGGQISVYIVRKGDTLSEIAEMFGVSTNTILWANDIKTSSIREGQELVILPISGVRHVVKGGDTLQSVANKYKADLGDILSYNGLAASSKIKPGDIIIIPDGVISATQTSLAKASGVQMSQAYPTYTGYYLRPVSGRKTQGIHGNNGVDLAAPTGTPILAAADGKVIVSRNGGYNGGYGTYVVINHSNGTQTLYAHMSRNNVSVGQNVAQGQTIGAVGSTGKSTGPHLHFEIRGARNPF